MSGSSNGKLSSEATKQALLITHEAVDYTNMKWIFCGIADD
jgi:hypothetical protein